MSETKRSVAEIQKDYSELCLRAGHLAYSIKALQIDLESVQSVQKDLNLEGAEAQRREAEEAKAAAEAPKLEVVS